MDEQYSWKRTEEIEIDMADLLQRIFRQWKRIAVCALASALILGGSEWLKNLAEQDELTEEEEQEAASAVLLENEIRELEEYLNESVLMHLDPYHKNKAVMLYSIDHAKRQELAAITESYLNFVSNGGAADVLRESGGIWKTDKNYLAELICAYQKLYSSPYQVAVDGLDDSSMFSESLFYVEVTGRSAKEAEEMALDLQDVLEEYSAKAEEAAGSHRLVLVSSERSVTADSSLQTQQREKRALLSSDKANLKTMTNAFSEKQRKVYQEAVREKDTADQDEAWKDSADDSASDETFRSVIEYVFLGLMGGMGVYCCAFACWYVFCDKIKNTEEMRRIYKFPVYGAIPLQSGAGKNDRTVPHIAGPDAYGYTEAQVLNRIRLMCKKHGMTKLCAAADFPLSVQEKECLESISRQLKAWKIDMKVTESAGSNTEVWDVLSETGNVMLVCRIGTTTHRMIDDAMRFYLENGMTAACAVVFSQNR